MIYLNVAFLVISCTYKNIVKILINASPHAVTSTQATGFSVHVCYNMVDGMRERVSLGVSIEYIYNPQRCLSFNLSFYFGCYG